MTNRIETRRSAGAEQSQFRPSSRVSRVAEGQGLCLLRPLQTGLADFPHPAYPNSFDHNACTGNSAARRLRTQRLETQPTQVSVHRLTFREPVGSLTATSQVTTQPLQRVPVQIAERFAGVAVSEVRTPTHQPTAHLGNHLVDGHEASSIARQLLQLRSGSRQRFLRGKHVQVTPGPSETVSVVTQREAQKAQALTLLRKLHRPSLLAVDRQPESPFERLLDPTFTSRLEV